MNFEPLLQVLEKYLLELEKFFEFLYQNLCVRLKKIVK